jgi:hypothetical protein
MGLIQDAIAEAQDRSVATSDLLRTCQVVAFRLKHRGLKEWLNFDCRGFPTMPSSPRIASWPEYASRRRSSIPPAGTEESMCRSDRSLPRTTSPPQRVHLGGPVAELEGLARNASSTLRTHPVPADVFTQLEIVEMSTTLELWGELSAHAVVGLLDQIRTRALTLLLELEAANSDAGESIGDSPAVAAETVDRIVQTVIYAGSVMVAPAAQIAVQQVVIQPGDLDALVAWARQTGVPEATIRQLPDAISAEEGTFAECRDAAFISLVRLQ